MFEKEAEEYYNGQYDAWLEGEEGYALEEEVEQAFKDGAEFGYNKGKEDASGIINELLINGYDESTREKALNFIYPDEEKEDEQ